MTTSRTSRLKLGIGLLVLGASCNAVGLGLIISPERPEDTGAGIFWTLFSIVALVAPAIVLIVVARRDALRAARMQKLVALATASQRLPFATLAADLQVSTDVARALLLEAIGQRLVIGRLDLEDGVFVSGSTHGGVQQLTMRCRNCGASSTVIVSAASESLCQYCGFRLA